MDRYVRQPRLQQLLDDQDLRRRQNSGYANSDDGTGPGDVAYLYGSTARDTFNARKNDTYLGGVGFNNQATGFDAVHGDVLSGDDRAYFHDWTGDDTFWSRGGTARLHERPWIYGGR